MNRKKILFIINPISGGRNKSTMEDLIQNHLNHDIYNHEIKYTHYAGHGAEIAKTSHIHFDIIVAVGGDGTINEIARELKASNCSLGIIAQGSGNGLARHLGLSLNPKKAIQELNSSHEIFIDTAVLNGHFFVSIAGIGFDSLIAEMFAQSESRGFVGYASLSTKEFFKYKEQSYRICIDGEWINRDAFLIAFANSNQFGYDTKISPLADIQDGFLDVSILKKPRLDQMPLGFYHLWTSRAHHSNLVEIIRAQEIMISPNINENANVDGESIHVGQEVKVKIKPKSLSVWIPKI